MGRIYDSFKDLWFGGYDPPRDEADAPPAVETDDGVTIVNIGQPSFPSLATPAGYGALMSVDYAACEQTKCRSLASLPVKVVSGKDRRDPVPGHPLAVLLSGMANDEMTGVDLRTWTRLRCDTFGNAYWRVEWYKDEPVALWPVLGSVRHDFDRDRPAGRRTVYDLGGDKYTNAGRYFSEEIVNIKTHITKDGMKGVSLAKLAAEQIGLSVDLERFYKSMLENGNHHLGHVEIDAKSIPDPAKDDLRAAIEAKSGVANAGKVPIFGYGAKWVSDRQTMKDASLIEQQEWVLHQVCRACNVPPWKVYDQKGTTYAGSQQANIDYVTDTVVPDVLMIEKACMPIFLARGERDLSLKLDVRGLMRGDDKSRSQYYREMTYAGAYTRADVREYEDLPPIDGLDKPLFPLNYGAVEADGSVTVYSNAPTAPADGSQTGVTE